MLKNNLCFFSQSLFFLPRTLLAINPSSVLFAKKYLDFPPTLILQGSALYKWYLPNRMQPILHWQEKKCGTTALVSQITGLLAPICSRLSTEDMSSLWLVSCQGPILNVRPLWCDGHWNTGTHPSFHVFIYNAACNLDEHRRYWKDVMPQFDCRACRSHQSWTKRLV